MKIKKFIINKYRSIERVEIDFPDKQPLVLFGANNAGKSNILSALNVALGEFYPINSEMKDSDYFMRDKVANPEIQFYCKFTDTIHTSKYGNAYDAIVLNFYADVTKNNTFTDKDFNKLYISNDDRAKCQSRLIDAVRNIVSEFNYSSKYSILSKFSHKIHEALTVDKKIRLSGLFSEIISVFSSLDKFTEFEKCFKDSTASALAGFSYGLEVDFSGYDPNNYTKSLRIQGKEGNDIRSLDEMGTGEQQVLLLSFIKSYMEVFTNENFVLIIEEPEAHLHPLAQRWLKEYMLQMCEAGIQVVISTHSTEFLDAKYLDSLVRVYKENGITKIKQINAKQLCEKCLELKSSPQNTKQENILDFYEARLLHEQLKGFFADKIILVEGDTEYFSLPYYFKNCGISLAQHGVEIINCHGKDKILSYYRLFKAFGYDCYCLFDGDSNLGNDEYKAVFKIDDINNADNVCVATNQYAYFGKDFETYMRKNIDTYTTTENEVKTTYFINAKPLLAKIVAQKNNFQPAFIADIFSLFIKKPEKIEIPDDEDLPF